MKKLLSICFLSILLGLLSFSTQAQSNTGSSCASGFWIENLQPTTIHEIANLPADMPNTGDLPLTHTLGQLWYGSTGQYLGNAHPGQTELYELHFCNTCGLDPKTKVSIDWLVIRDGDTINDNLSDYMEFSIYTFYNQLNQYGECQSISWLGGQVNDGFGYCEAVNPNGYTLYDSIHGLNTGCHVPTNYPGALQVTQGTPYSVLNQLGQVVPAMGPVHIYTEALDYFYLDFFEQTRNIVQIKWKQVGDYKLVMRIRERVGGTPYMNLNWNQNETTDFIGGHQSCCGNVIAEDVINFPTFGAIDKAVCQQEKWTFGRPDYTFNNDLSDRSYDTNVVFGQYVGFGTNNTECRYFQTDSIYYVDFFVRHTPVIVVKDTNLCRCETPDVMASITVDTVGLHDTQCSYKIQWMHSDTKWYDEQGYYTKYPDNYSNPPASWNGDTTYTYIVRQINTYDDTLDCVGPQAQFTVTLKEMLAPVITSPAVDTLEFCLEAIDATTKLNLAAQAQDACGTTIHWYTKLRSSFYYNSLSIGNTFTSYIDKNSNLEGATPQVFLANYLPSVNKDTTLYFFATSYNEGQGCESRKFDYFVVLIHQTPELTPHITKTVYCQHDNVEMQASIGNVPQDTDPNYTFVWTGVTSVDYVNPAPAPANMGTEVEISGSSKASYAYLPIHAYSGRNYSQQIFTPAEVPAGNITKMAFNYASNNDLTNKSSNVEIYLTTTDKNTFATKADFVTTNLVLVYTGGLNATKGWNEIKFDQPYNYTGEKNLVLVVKDNSDTYQSNRYFTCSNTSDYKAMAIRTDGTLPTDPTTYSGTVYRYQYRSDVKFTVVPAGAYTTTDNHQYAYNQLDPTGHQCGDTLRSSAYVIDGNGCTSQPVNFVYVMNDTIAPTVTGAIATTRVNACKLDATNTYHYNTIADLPSTITIKDDAVVPGDNCGFPDLTMTYTSTYKDGDCEDTLTYNYTVTDWCGHTATFSHTFISHDSTAPEFHMPAGFPYVRLFPVEGGNCTFNSPDSMDFVNAVAPFVYDNCTDSAYLMSTLTFNWENTTESPIGKTNIFLEKNHLTVEATITDSCGNSTKQLVIYIDRPDKIQIKPNGITANANICFNDTVHMTFDPAFIQDDTIMGPFVPYTYKWKEKNNKTGVHFDDNTALTTNITFDEPGDYVFVMTVTDRNGCSAESEPINVNVRALPNVVINHIVLNGQTEPYCPTYGNLTVRAEIVNPVAGQTVAPNAYVWTGESVNIHSDSARTWVTIVPEWCDTVYYPTVTVTDDRGCVNSVTDTINVASSGPQFVGTIADTTVEKQMGCKFYIPNLKNLVDANLVQDDCYTFSQIKYSDAYGTIERTDWYSQSPAAGTELTENTKVVTITIKNPCGKTNTLNVNVLKPTDVLAVTITPTIDSLCQEEILTTGVDYTATVVNELPAGSETYNWELIVKPTGSTATIPTVHNNATLTIQQALEAGVYQYKVNVVDGLGCTASATSDLYVKFQGADPYVRTWPNTLCERYNGALAVDTTPNAYVYILEPLDHATPAITKISDVPEHQTTPWNTIVFDSLRPTQYQLTVITNEGCERVHSPYTILDARQGLEPTVFTTTNVSLCSSDNGTVTITPRANYTYSLYYVANDSLVGTGLNYNSLSVGQYRIHSVNTVTHCVKDTVFNINDVSTRPNPTYTVPVANKNCVNAGGVYTGQIKITSSTSFYYTVYAVNGSDTTWYLNNELLTSTNNPIKNLKDGTYYVTAYDPATGCSTASAKTMTVGTAISTPSILTAKTSNHYCTTTLADGTVSITNANRFLTYQLDQKNGLFSYDSIGDQTSATLVSNKATWDSLYDKTYRISAVADNYCTATPVQVTVASETINPQVTATSTMNPSCTKEQGTLKLTTTNASTMNQSSYGYAHIASYKIEKGSFVKDTATTANTFTFTNLASGTYTWTATTNFGCTTTGTKEVEQYQLPSMLLDSTPNHMCASTFEKPGDGTIKIRRPIVGDPTGNHFFEYKFYDAAGNEMTVPYDLPLTKTKYWLAAGYYHVVAVDTVSGCTVDGYITVEDSLYKVDFDYTTTPNYICGTSTVGNGTITVVNPTSDNPDANLGVFVYSMDGTTYQSNPTFTGLKDGVYTIYVKDTTYQCEKVKNNVIVNATDSCAPVITITDGVTTGTQFDYCYGALGIQLCGSVNDTCNPSNNYTFGWYAPCADPNTSNTNCINVQTDHYVINGCDYIFTATNTATGCSYSKTVNVAIHPNPVLVFTINGNPATTDQSNWFCETEPLHIAVHSQNPEVILDTTSINWTLGKIATGIAEFDTIGSAMAGNAVTFCVRANSEYGCPSGNASLPVSIIRTDSVFVKDTACTKYITTTDATHPTAVTITPAAYPFDTVIVREYTKLAPVHGNYCDSIVTYNVHINDKPVITLKNNPAPFCESAGYTLADFVDSFNVVWNGDEGSVKWFAAVGTGTYTKVTAVADITEGDYVITNANGDRVMLSSTVPSGVALQAGTTIELSNPPATNIWSLVKNSDNTYSFYNAAIGKYIAGFGGSTNEVELVSTNTADRAKWNITITGANTRVENVAYPGRYLMYNEGSPRFATYSGTQKWLSLYKGSSAYAEVTTNPDLTYDYVTTHTIKRVAENCCGTDEAHINFNVVKQPAINSFVAGNRHCAGEMHAFTANVSTYGTAAIAKLFIEGNSTPLATTTVNGLNQDVTFTAVKIPHAYNGKTITISVVNNCNPDCGAVSIDSVLAVDTAIISDFVAINNPHCVGTQLTIADFTGFNPSAYSSYQLKRIAGTDPAPATDPVITLPYDFTDRSMNNALVYIVAVNNCYPQIVSNFDTLFVNGKPSVAAIANIDQCAPTTFTLAEPTITWNGSDSLTSGWLLLKSGAYTTATLAEIKDSAICPKTAHAAYFAQGSCGFDTAFFTVNFSLPPTVSTFTFTTQCPKEIVYDAISSKTVSQNCNTLTSETWKIEKADGTGVQTLSVAQLQALTFNTLLTDGYNGGKLTHYAANDCGNNSQYATFNIPVYAYDTFKLQSACNNTALENFIQSGTYDWKGTGVTITSTFWSVNGTKVNAGTYIVKSVNTPLNVTYSYVTSCNDTVTTIAKELSTFINDKPEVNLTTLAAMCEGDTIKEASLLANLTVNYIQPSTAASYDTTWYLGANVLTLPYVVSYADSGKKVIVSINEKVANTTCGNTNDTIELVVYPRPNPTITGPADACADEPLSTPFNAIAGYVNYHFTVVGEATATPATQNGPSNIYNPVFSLSTPLSSAHDSVYVTVTDNRGCVATSSSPAIIRVTNAPSFIFKDMTGMESHSYVLADTGIALQYTWAIGVECFKENPLVYVEYDIYHNDTLIANNKIGSYLKTQFTGGVGMPGSPYVTSNKLDWCANHGVARSQTLYYNYASANTTAANTGNHFPYSTLGEGSGHDYFDCFFLKFLAQRSTTNPDANAVTATITPFRISGDYKVVYRLMATDIPNRLYYYYSPDCVDGVLDTIGSKMAMSGNTWLLAIDSISIEVRGHATSIADDTNDEEVAETAPELAPVISDVENVTPDMEVWPNPAPAVETTLKARVHNMSGNATVTLTSLTGKQVYNGKIFIDNDNYYFEFNVNSLSVGSYIMTVRTDTDVITKKVIVSRLAK